MKAKAEHEEPTKKIDKAKIYERKIKKNVKKEKERK